MLNEMKPMSDTKSNKRNFFGIALVGFGILLLLHNLNMIPGIPSYLFSWKMIFILIGMYLLVSGEIFKGIIFSGIGIYFLLPEILHIPVRDLNLFWPGLLILFGLKFLFGRREKRIGRLMNKSVTPDSDRIDVSTFMSGESRNISSYNFTGGNIYSVMGGAELDLTNCTLAKSGAIIDLSIVMGGVTLIVPREWNVRSEVTSIMGGIEDTLFNDPDIYIDPAAELVLRGRIVMGGIEIKRL
jgi:predicted membrane protein